MNILFLADPNSIHDIKWISFFSGRNNCYLFSRKIHQIDKFDIERLRKVNINYLGSVNDFTTARFWENLLELRKIKKWIESENISLIHILYTEPNVLWANFRSYLQIPIVASTRGSDVLITIKNTFASRSLLNYFVGFLYQRAFRKCDFITATSHSQLRELRKNGADQRKAAIIRTGIDLDAMELSIVQETTNLIKGDYILFPRNMRPVYNHELAISSLNLLPKKIKEKYTFVFLDSDSISSDYVNKIKRKIKDSSGLNFQFLKRLSQENLWNLINNACLVIMTNTSDGAPVTAMETMCLKTPLLMSPLNYDNDIFKFIPKFSEFSPESVANAIETVLLKREYSVMEANRNLIIELCNRPVEMNKLEEIYKSLSPATQK